MQVNLKKIDAFYHSELGVYAHGQISKCLAKIIPNQCNKMACVSSSSGFAYGDIVNDFNRLALQSYHIADNWPDAGQGHFIVADRDAWPYRAEDVDVILMIHDIEFAEHSDVYLREAWRTLKGEGQLIVVFPNRSGKWAKYDTTPFGLGYPHTLKQMQNLLSKAHFTIDRVEKSLFFPAYQPKTRIAKLYRRLIDCIGHFCFFEAGVYVISASKHTYSPTKGLAVKDAAQKARQVLFPAPSAAPSAKVGKGS